ncbi:emp24/gp25L/p24 family/GOLD-domain-containing protein [Rhodofomes roseus]|uniref:Emp24/gp25L/p24 family/GOLD-domain-containing protein n=1 Tax=Rhodofomes roseus TaxID=34475 RepID=A0ABQ8KFH0_9APHY|nr:emp24/gp25L/p24 family/GOLD-domain-containing protein [Rhodofomes roseus]KAH9836258.1 emp24/gp25L/p24 family/GOLD-domain-containing protein [Rhodofomes roseus]
MTSLFRRPSRGLGLSTLWLAAVLLLLCQPTHAIKFALQAARFPAPKCVWNAAHPGALVIVTANIGPGEHQRVDIEIIDSGPQRNVYLSKKNISGEKRFAVTAHSDEDVGVCFRNYVDAGKQGGPVEAKPRSRVIDLDIDIGADAVDYNAIANQESLSGLETEMRKLEGVVKEIVDEMDYLKTREERFQATNISTGIRVQNFAWFTLFSLVALGLWQIFHLRAFFKRKYLID